MKMPEPLIANQEDLGDYIQHNIQLKEFVCKCGCSGYIVNDQLINGLQMVRNRANETIEPYEVKIKITSGFRCVKYNGAIGGASRSFHCQGMAADWYLYFEKDDGSVHCVDVRGMFKIAVELGMFHGIGAYNTGFIHTDIRCLDIYNIWFQTKKTRTYLSECIKK